MVYVPHLRVTAIGTLGTPSAVEEWQVNLSLAQDDQGDWAGVFNLEPNATVFDDIRDDLAAWVGRADSQIRQVARLQRVKIAWIGADGKYTRSPVERDGGNVAGVHPNEGIFPFQCAVAITLGTDADLGRVKGRIYSPAPAVTINQASGQIDVAQQTAMRTSADTLLTNLGNQPGLDVLGLKVVVASQGRHNANGTVKLPPGNHEVTRVNVGRVVDTIRSRRSKLVEAPVYADVDQ